MGERGRRKEVGWDEGVWKGDTKGRRGENGTGAWGTVGISLYMVDCSRWIRTLDKRPRRSRRWLPQRSMHIAPCTLPMHIAPCKPCLAMPCHAHRPRHAGTVPNRCRAPSPTGQPCRANRFSPTLPFVSTCTHPCSYLLTPVSPLCLAFRVLTRHSCAATGSMHWQVGAGGGAGGLYAEGQEDVC